MHKSKPTYHLNGCVNRYRHLMLKSSLGHECSVIIYSFLSRQHLQLHAMLLLISQYAIKPEVHFRIFFFFFSMHNKENEGLRQWKTQINFTANTGTKIFLDNLLLLEWLGLRKLIINIHIKLSYSLGLQTFHSRYLI